MHTALSLPLVCPRFSTVESKTASLNVFFAVLIGGVGEWYRLRGSSRNNNTKRNKHRKRRACFVFYNKGIQVGHIAPGSSAAAATAALALYEGENSCSSTRLLLYSYSRQQQHHKAGNDAGAAQLSSVVT
jgi:hypothetical protein